MNYADYNTPYVRSENVDVTLEKLEKVGKVFFKWFLNNFLKADTDKYLILLTDEPFSSNTHNEVIKNSSNSKLLRINLNNRLGFDTYVTNIINWVSKKLHILATISHCMNIYSGRMTMKAFIAYEFGYCPLVWLFHSRKLNNQVNNLHERALRIAYQDYTFSFTELLEKDNSATIYNRNIQLVFKVKNGLFPSIYERNLCEKCTALLWLI